MRVAIMGNSGSGKSTLARLLVRQAPNRAECAADEIPILDLDTLAWESTPPPTRRPLAAAGADLHQFCTKHGEWIIEGCYGDLIEHALAFRPELIFLNPAVQACLENCRSRPWEPHKYATKAAQDANLDFLLSWVRDYYKRDDDCSLNRHRAILAAYDGPKRELTSFRS